MPSNSSFLQRHLWKIIAVLMVILLIWLGLTIKQALTFHVVNTNPATSSVATVSPFFKINFNRQLKPSSVIVTASSSIIISSNVSNKMVTVNLKTPLTASKSYTITLKSASDMSGHIIRDKVFTFTPSLVNTSDLPPDQRNALLRQQASHPDKFRSTVFTGTDALTHEGITTTQLSILQHEFSEFNAKAALVAINPSSVQNGPLNGSGTFTVNFTVTIDKTTYSGLLTYSDINSIELTLNDTLGNQVFDANS